MTAEEIREWVRTVVDAFPPLTDEQRERITALLWPADHTEAKRR